MGDSLPRGPAWLPHPCQRAARSYSMLPVNTLASEEVEIRKKPWKGITAPSFEMKSAWRMENRMAPLFPESSSLAWEQDRVNKLWGLGQARHPRQPQQESEARVAWEPGPAVTSIGFPQATDQML